MWMFSLTLQGADHGASVFVERWDIPVRSPILQVEEEAAPFWPNRTYFEEE